jgi:centrin-1
LHGEPLEPGPESEFNLFNDNNTGTIPFKNRKRVSIELGENLTDGEQGEMLEESDHDNDGEISFDKFVRIMKKTSLFQRT